MGLEPSGVGSAIGHKVPGAAQNSGNSHNAIIFLEDNNFDSFYLGTNPEMASEKVVVGYEKCRTIEKYIMEAK